MRQRSRVLHVLARGRRYAIRCLTGRLFTDPTAVQQSVLMLRRSNQIIGDCNNISLTSNTRTRAPSFRRQRGGGRTIGVTLTQHTTTVVRSNSAILLSDSSAITRVIPRLDTAHGVAIIAGDLQIARTLRGVRIEICYANNRYLNSRAALNNDLARTTLQGFGISVLFFSAHNVSAGNVVGSSDSVGYRAQHIVVHTTTHDMLLYSDDGLGHGCLFGLYRIGRISAILYSRPLPRG